MKLTVIFLFLSATVFGQRLKVTQMNDDYFHHEKVGGFYYLHEETPEEAYQWIADITVTFDSLMSHTLSDVYRRVRSKSHKLSANAFRVKESNIFSLGHQKVIKMSVYYLRMERRDLNRSYFETNKIRLFGFLGYHENVKGYPVAVNDTDILITELSYKEIELKKNDILTVKIDKGMKARTLKVAGDEEMTSMNLKFDMFRGFFNRSSISEYEWSVGEFLKRILKKEVLEVPKSS